MAKLELIESQLKQKKAKGKKRKLASLEHDDEVANKSLIVDHEKSAEPESNESAQASATKSLKRKNKANSNVKDKRSKCTEDTPQDGEHEEVVLNGAEEMDLHEPTAEELRESQKPENTKAIVTVRQKKKQKHQERQEAQKGQSVGKEMKRNAEYLQKWKHARAQWKFEKLRQISIQLTMFDDTKVDENTWPIALEYLSGSKGAAKDKITKLAEAVIEELDVKCSKLEDEAAQQTIVDSARYQRARELLQSFD